MDQIQKALSKFSPLEKTWTDEIFKKLYSNNIKDLDIKKLKGRDDIFRVRKGDVRVIYRLAENGHMLLLLKNFCLKKNL